MTQVVPLPRRPCCSEPCARSAPWLYCPPRSWPSRYASPTPGVRPRVLAAGDTCPRFQVSKVFNLYTDATPLRVALVTGQKSLAKEQESLVQKT